MVLVLVALLCACVPARSRSVASSPDHAAPESARPAPTRTPRAVVPVPVSTAARAPSRADGEAEYLRARELMVPVEGVAPSQVPNTFNAPRGSRRHNALDIMAPRGTPVLAADDGRILSMRRNTAGGIIIYLVDSDERMVHYYAHLQGYRKGLAEGDRVRKGEIIGYVGTTGNAPENVPHLHFQLMRLTDVRRYWEGAPVNPHGFFAEPGRKRD